MAINKQPTYYVDPITGVLIFSIISFGSSALAAFICHKLNAPLLTGIGIITVFYSIYAFIRSLIEGSYDARAAGVFLLLVGALLIGIHYLN